MYIRAVFINVSSKWRSCRNFMRSGHKSGDNNTIYVSDKQKTL